MLLRLDDRERDAILRAMATVATGAGSYPLSAVDRIALAAAHHVVFGGVGDVDPGALAPISPADLARALPPAIAAEAVRFLTVTALIDGILDATRLAALRGFADGLGVHEEYFRDIAEAARGHLAWVAADLGRQNVISITDGRITTANDFPFFPYREGGGVAELEQRYRGLEALAKGTLGRGFFDWYRSHGFAFPGQPEGLNERFIQPHDSLHLLSGYSTSPQGEILVSTFTAGALGPEGFGAHILPVIFSWHLGIELNQVAGSFRGALEPEKFWVAWDRGAAMKVNCFADTWEFWSVVAVPLDELRQRYGIPPLDPRFAAVETAPSTYRPFA